MIRKTENGYILNVHVIPNARKVKIQREGDTLVVYLSSPPIGGKANKELLRLISSILGIPKRNVEILRGEKSRDKQILIKGKGASLSEEDIIKLIEEG
ncbi:MAG: DUF167 domain-containing protein [Candidatus Njordarchaeia archaeon]